MADPSIYGGSEWTRTPANGTVVMLSIASSVARQTTSTPCKRAHVQAHISNAGYIMMNINASATSVLGICLPCGPKVASITVTLSEASVPPPMTVEIDDVNKLYFWGKTDNDMVNILYTQ